MSNTHRPVFAALTALAVLVLTACTPSVTGQAGAAGGVGTTTTSETCDDVVHADPWIAFQTSLRSTDELVVGQRGWIAGVHETSEVKVTGDVAAVRVTKGSANTEIRCGKVISSASWIEIAAVRAGAVDLTLHGSSTGVIRLTVHGK